MCLPSDALLQHLLSYLGFFYLGHGVSLHGCSSKAQPLLLTLDEGYLLTTALPELQLGIAPLGPPATRQPRLLGRGVGPPGHRPWPPAWGSSSWPLPLASDAGYLLSAAPRPRLSRSQTRGSSSRPFPPGHSLVPSAAAPDLGRGVTPLGRRPSGMGSLLNETKPCPWGNPSWAGHGGEI